jgi:hypothetical protein
MTKTREDYFQQNFDLIDPITAWETVSVLQQPVWACQYCADTLEDEQEPDGTWVPAFTTIGEDPSDIEDMSFEEFLKYGPFAAYTA